MVAVVAEEEAVVGVDEAVDVEVSPASSFSRKEAADLATVAPLAINRYETEIRTPESDSVWCAMGNDYLCGDEMTNA